jgi:hypothetical protein
MRRLLAVKGLFQGGLRVIGVKIFSHPHSVGQIALLRWPHPVLAGYRRENCPSPRGVERGQTNLR